MGVDLGCRPQDEHAHMLPGMQTAVPRKGDAREDWTIVRALSEVLGQTLPYDSDEDVRARLADVAPHLAKVGGCQAPLWLNGQYFKVRVCEGLGPAGPVAEAA